MSFVVWAGVYLAIGRQRISLRGRFLIRRNTGRKQRARPVQLRSVCGRIGQAEAVQSGQAIAEPTRAIMFTVAEPLGDSASGP